MKRGPLKWLEFSRGDLRRAVVMASMRDYDYAAYLLQQSAEKAIKAVILKEIPTISGKEIKTHKHKATFEDIGEERHTNSG